MERLYYRFDKDGFYVEPVIIYEEFSKENPMPADLTDIRPPDGLWRGKFTGKKWIETGGPDEEDLKEQVRKWRNALLAGSDWTQLPDSPLSEEAKERERVYRQALRDLPSQPGFPDRITWPKAPDIYNPK